MANPASSASAASEPVLVEGWLHKKGKRWLMWQRRYVRLSAGGVLSWGKCVAPDASVKAIRLGEAEGACGLVDPGRYRKSSFGLVAGTHVMVLAADTDASMASWVSALSRFVTLTNPPVTHTHTHAQPRTSAGGTPAPQVQTYMDIEVYSTATASLTSPASSDSGGAALTPRASFPLPAITAPHATGHAPSHDTPRSRTLSIGSTGTTPSAHVASLPDDVEIDGFPDVGSEVHVRVRDGRLLDALSITWFRFVGAELPGHTGDVMMDARVKTIPGANGHTYTITAADVGARIGCCVRPASANGSRWSVMADSVQAVDPDALILRLAVLPHEHNKYCDRRVRVCTAGGRHREGNSVTAQLRGSPDKLAIPHMIEWYRSDSLSESERRRSPSSSGASTPMTGTTPRPDGPVLRHTGSVSDRRSHLFSTAALRFQRVFPHPVSDMPPLPPDYAPAPSTAEVLLHMEMLRRPQPSAPTWAPGYAGAPLVYPLFQEDVGRMLVALAVYADAAPPDSVSLDGVLRASGFHGTATASAPVLAASQVIGPIEAAPPRAREIWIEGEPRAGCLLVGKCYYYGGVEGESEVSWVAIGAEGDTTELKPPTPCSPAKALPALDAPSDPDVDAHPRVLRLDQQHVGSLIKFKVRPVRADGDEGHTESSRPTKEIMP